MVDRVAQSRDGIFAIVTCVVLTMSSQGRDDPRGAGERLDTDCQVTGDWHRATVIIVVAHDALSPVILSFWSFRAVVRAACPGLGGCSLGFGTCSCGSRATAHGRSRQAEP